ncbi:MAG: alpha/beta hydrolase [Chloroflexi bacterium]|nr:alpha/beta hydrolase [Chloroflexota bacterium]
MKIVRRILLVIVIVFAVFSLLPFLIPLPPVGADASTLPQAADGSFVDVNGTDTFYIERGPADGPTMLLLHGFGGLTFSWRLNIDALAEAGYRVIAFDRPPYGLTEKRADMSLSRAAQTDFTVAFMDALDIDSAIMVGHSAGGTVIADMALRYPERVDALVFVAGAVGSMSGGPPFVGTLLSFPPITRWAQIIARLAVTPDFFGNTLRSAYGSPDFMTPEMAAGYATPLQVRDWDIGFVGILRDSGGNALDASGLSAVTVPTLLIWGENDTWVPLRVGENLHSSMTGSTLITYPNVGHLPQEENPAQFNADLIAFLAASN